MNSWIIWLVVGVISLLGGLVALANPFAATLTAVVLTGWIFIIVGVLTFISAFSDQVWGGRILALFLSVLLVILGSNLVGQPLRGIIPLTYFTALMLIAAGVFRLLLGFGSSIPQLRWAMIVSGAISVLMAVMILSNFPQSAMVVLGVFLAFDLILNGVTIIVLALSRKTQTNN